MSRECIQINDFFEAVKCFNQTFETKILKDAFLLLLSGTSI